MGKKKAWFGSQATDHVQLRSVGIETERKRRVMGSVAISRNFFDFGDWA
jgi:hypothetical protein